MSTSSVSPIRMSATEFLAMERSASTKHELWDGEVFAMAGASLAHNIVVANLTRLLGNLVVDGPCIVLPSDMKVHVPTSEGYVYPDVSVICGEPSLLGSERDVATNPCVVIEVLSESTERFDRGDKFAGYRSLPSIADYVLVATTRARVEHYERGPDDTWVLREHGPGSTLRLRSIAGSVAIDEIYRKVPSIQLGPVAQG